MTTHELFPTTDIAADITADITGSVDAPATTQDDTGQLRLLDTSDMPLQFRLDKATRERGLAHVAELRRRLSSRPSPFAA